MFLEENFQKGDGITDTIRDCRIYHKGPLHKM